MSYDSNGNETIDHHIIRLANKKMIINKIFENKIIEKSIDYNLFTNI